MDLETKHKKIKEYLKELRYKVKVEKGIDLNDERLEKAINKYCSKEYDSVSFEKIKEEIDKELKQLMEWILKEKENYKEMKFKELKELYEKNKEK